MTTTIKTAATLCAALALSACAAPIADRPETFSGSGVSGPDCGWNNPSAIAPNTPCPPR